MTSCSIAVSPSTRRTSAGMSSFVTKNATQSTLLPEKGHLVRCRAHPERVVRDAALWAQLKFQ